MGMRSVRKEPPPVTLFHRLDSESPRAAYAVDGSRPAATARSTTAISSAMIARISAVSVPAEVRLPHAAVKAA